jgi:hypothetical protein
MCSFSVIETGTCTPESAASPVPANPAFVAMDALNERVPLVDVVIFELRMTDAEVERLMAASRKSSRYGYRDATQISVLPCANPRRGALGAANMNANGHVRVCFRQIEKNRHERFTHSQ